MSSQGSVQGGETSQEWQPTPRVEHKPQSLNNFLRRTSDRSESPVRSQCKSDELTISASTQRYYRRKAEQVVDVVLDSIAPGKSTWLFEQVRSKRNIIQVVLNVGEDTLVSRLVTCYEEAGSWYNRQQILLLFAGDYSKTELLQMIPGLTKWRIDEARKHALKNKPGQPIEPPTLQRTRLDPAKVNHFLYFISSPSFLQDVAYGTRNLKLTTGEKIETPSVVHTVISSRLVQLYLKYFFFLMIRRSPRSTLLSIFKVSLSLTVVNHPYNRCHFLPIFSPLDSPPIFSWYIIPSWTALLTLFAT